MVYLYDILGNSVAKDIRRSRMCGFQVFSTLAGYHSQQICMTTDGDQPNWVPDPQFPTLRYALKIGPMFCGTLTLILRCCGTLTLSMDSTVSVWFKSITIFSQESLSRFTLSANQVIYVVRSTWGCQHLPLSPVRTRTRTIRHHWGCHLRWIHVYIYKRIYWYIYIYIDHINKCSVTCYLYYTVLFYTFHILY